MVESALGVVQVDGLIYVSDVTRSKVAVYNATSRGDAADTAGYPIPGVLDHVRSIAPSKAVLERVSKPFSPHGLAWHAATATLYVSDADNRCVWTFVATSPSSNTMSQGRTIGGAADDDEGTRALFEGPRRGVAIFRNRLFVCEPRRIHVLSLSDLTPLQPPVAVPGSEAMLGLGVHNGRLYAADPQAAKVFVLDLGRRRGRRQRSSSEQTHAFELRTRT